MSNSTPEKETLGEGRAKYCRYCGKRYTTLAGLTRHIAREHNKTLEDFEDTKEIF